MLPLYDARSNHKTLESLGDPAIAEHSQRFFKSGPGEYGEGDIFRGIRVPVLRKTAKQFKDLSIDHTVELLHSPFHEDRLTALLIFVLKYKKGQSERNRRSMIPTWPIPNSSTTGTW